MCIRDRTKAAPECKEDKKVRIKAKALLHIAAEETKTVRKFFQNDIEYDIAPRSFSPPCVVPQRKTAVATVDFYDFYKKAIKTRVQKKLEEEEEKKSFKICPSIPSVTISLDDDITHPPELTRSPPQNPQAAGDDTPPKKKPRRREQAGNLSWISQLFVMFIHQHGVCLLYTSPSPRDQRGSRMPSSA
eukprot:TRINITY_DN6591_c0_g1_i1.p2 TRINITY_DN6591_c0_g1~~TRINITY_DN6591_c0_g1_i1.p2  ORF type:complete len:188 (-),score=82.33 TRINITY_DN6591_c0_g1_i1:10-573(-)